MSLGRADLANARAARQRVKQQQAIEPLNALPDELLHPASGSGLPQGRSEQEWRARVEREQQRLDEFCGGCGLTADPHQVLQAEAVERRVRGGMDRAALMTAAVYAEAAMLASAGGDILAAGRAVFAVGRWVASSASKAGKGWLARLLSRERGPRDKPLIELPEAVLYRTPDDEPVVITVVYGGPDNEARALFRVPSDAPVQRRKEGYWAECFGVAECDEFWHYPDGGEPQLIERRGDLHAGEGNKLPPDSIGFDRLIELITPEEVNDWLDAHGYTPLFNDRLNRPR